MPVPVSTHQIWAAAIGKAGHRRWIDWVRPTITDEDDHALQNGVEGKIYRKENCTLSTNSNYVGLFNINTLWTCWSNIVSLSVFDLGIGICYVCNTPVQLPMLFAIHSFLVITDNNWGNGKTTADRLQCRPKAQYTSPTRRNCRVASSRRRRCVHEFATSSRRLPTDSVMWTQPSAVTEFTILQLML